VVELAAPELLELFALPELAELLHAANITMHPTTAEKAARRCHFPLRRVFIDDHPFLFS
jgi:hypothetical protein